MRGTFWDRYARLKMPVPQIAGLDDAQLRDFMLDCVGAECVH